MTLKTNKKLEEKDYYTKEELANSFGCSTRTIQRHIKSIGDTLSKRGINDKIPLNIALEIAKKYNYDFQKEINGQLVVEEYFTTEEYAEFQKRISQYPLLKEYIEELKKQNDHLLFLSASQSKTIETLTNSIQQRNFIEVKDKGFDK